LSNALIAMDLAKKMFQGLNVLLAMEEGNFAKYTAVIMATKKVCI